MNTVTKTYGEVIAFVQAANAVLQKTTQETKFTWALRRVVKPASDIVNQYNDEIATIDIQNASEDERGNLIKQDGALVYTKENAKKRNTEKLALFRKSVECPCYIATSLPKDLPLQFRDSFEGFVIAPAEEPAD